MIVGVGVSTENPYSYCSALHDYFCPQRNGVHAWDMKGNKPTFALKPKELNGVELPKGTVLEVEFVQELQGEVRSIFSTC